MALVSALYYTEVSHLCKKQTLWGKSRSTCHIFVHQETWLLYNNHCEGGQTGIPNILSPMMTHILCWKWPQVTLTAAVALTGGQLSSNSKLNALTAAKQCFKVIQQMARHAMLKAGQREFLLLCRCLNIQFCESCFQMVLSYARL